MGGHLVVPEELSRGSGENDERVGVERRAREPASIRERLRPAPRARIRDARIDVATLVDADRVPGAAAAARLGMWPRLLDRLEAPDDPAGRGRQCVQDAAAPRREALRADVHAAAVGDRRDADELLELVRQPTRPEPSSRRRVERERRRVGGAVESRARDREAVRAVVRRVEGVLPEQGAASYVECVDARGRVLQIDGVAPDDRVRGDRAEARDVRTQPKTPAHPEPRDGPRVERGRGDVAARPPHPAASPANDSARATAATHPRTCTDLRKRVMVDTD